MIPRWLKTLAAVAFVLLIEYLWCVALMQRIDLALKESTHAHRVHLEHR